LGDIIARPSSPVKTRPKCPFDARARYLGRVIALATSYDRRAVSAPEAVIGRALTIFDRAGVTGGALVLDAHFGRDRGGERLAALIALLEVRRDELPVIALEDPSGLHRAAALGALDREESRAAVAAAEATLRRAAALSASFVVLRLGWVEGARRDWTFARDRFLAGRLPASLGQRLVAARDKIAAAQIDRARAALDRLSRLAEGLGVSLLLKNGQRYVELPSSRELDQLRADLRGAPIQPLFDLPAAHLGDAMGLQPMPLAEAAFGGGPLIYMGDACGAIAALPAGDGELGRDGVAAMLSRSGEAIRCFRPWPALTDEEIARGLASR
jgi:hypothetical protein